MRFFYIILGYVKWHYTSAITSLSNIWLNFLDFVLYFFSIKLLFTNFFSPWKRMSDSYSKNFDLQQYLFAFIANSIMRVVGMIMRSILIIIGLLTYLTLIILYPLVIIIWIFMPAILLAMISIGIYLIIK